jgi:hypothetical protein
MDFYSVVGELTFPKGGVRAWLAGVGSLLDEIREGVMDRGEFVSIEIGEAKVSVRSTLVDDVFWEYGEQIVSALTAAAEHGASGEWFSGDAESGAGDHVTLDKGRAKATKRSGSGADGSRVFAWIQESTHLAAAKKPAAKKPAAKKRK